ncbi:MAG: hypothetical protein WCD53_20630 [Microcoleus sp.]
MNLNFDLDKNGIQFTCLLAKHGVKINSITSDKVISHVSYNNDRISSPGRTDSQKPGFLPNLRAATKYFRKKPGFSAPMRPGK